MDRTGAIDHDVGFFEAPLCSLYTKKLMVVSFFGGFEKHRSVNFVFSIVFAGPGGFGKVREAGRTNFLQISSKSDLMVPSYDRKREKDNH